VRKDRRRVKREGVVRSSGGKRGGKWKEKVREGE